MRRDHAFAAPLTAVLLVGSWSAPAAAQLHPVHPDVPLQAQLEGLIATRWDLDAAQVRVELMDGSVTSPVDSLLVRGGTSDRWIVTLWAGDGVTRRFVRAGVARPVPVASGDLPRNHEVLAEDVHTDTRVVWGPPRPPAPHPVGMVTSRRGTAGEPLAAPAVRPPLMFKGGDPVEAVLDQAGVHLRVRAEALASAREGDRIFVRLESGKRMAALAIAKGLVQLITGGDR